MVSGGDSWARPKRNCLRPSALQSEAQAHATMKAYDTFTNAATESALKVILTNDAPR